LSQLGAETLMKRIFAVNSYNELMSTFPKIRTLHQSLMEGVRLVQVFSYEFEEAFLAEYVPPVVKKGKGKKREPTPVLYGQNGLLVVWKPNGMLWKCSPGRDIEFWEDGMVTIDDHNIRWNEALQRFTLHGAPLQWAWHPELGNEREGLPGGRAVPAPEPEWDDDDDRMDDWDE
jgi:hypothetical protein